ncbi:MAG TPA: protein kinase, partial [Gaiellaceae bacterium]|nr:protein kinase [Gaiellaceae bacterium]
MARLFPGTIFQDAYEILEALGIGSFGRVYKARQLSTGQLVAIKVMHFREAEPPPDAENQIERFRREMRLCAELSHPNIVRLVDSGKTAEGELFAAFQYVPGSTLRDVLAQEQSLGWSETVHLMTQVLDALECAHSRGVVHRDLKPENIMVTKTGVQRHAMVVDFGLGGLSRDGNGWDLKRLTLDQEAMGTPCYAAPEQLRGEPPSPRSDIYSWALVFLECLTGEVLVGGRSTHEIMAKQLSADPVPIPGCIRDRRLRRLFETATAKRVDKRDVAIDVLMHALAASQGEASETPALPVADGERRQVTVASVGLRVSTADGLPPDFEELDEILHGEHTRLGQLVARTGGHVAAVTGGSMLIAFGYPQAREDDARRAVRTVLRIAAELDRSNERLAAERGLRLELRAGIHTGLVILRDRPSNQPLEMVGVTPQVATRLHDLARPGEILASQETQRLLRGTVRCQAAGEQRLPELSRALPVFRVTEVGPRIELDPTSFVRETPLVGRRDVLGRLVALWRRTQDGRGGAALITGEPGIGKSRLVREIRRRVPLDSWLEARCAAESQDSPLRPLADMFAAMGEPLESMLARRGFDVAATLPPMAAALSLPADPRWPRRALPPEREKELVFDTFLRLLCAMAEDRPVVFTFEDLHWADPTTLELVALVVREIEGAAVGDGGPAGRIMVVATARPEFTPPWAASEVAPIPLVRLGRDETETMVNAGLASGRVVPAPVLEEVIRRS